METDLAIWIELPGLLPDQLGCLEQGIRGWSNVTNRFCVCVTPGYARKFSDLCRRAKNKCRR